MNKTGEKIYTIFAGVNGSGKSALYQQLTDKTLGDPFGIRVNFDEIIKEQFNHNWRDLKTQNLAGRIVVGMVSDCLKNGKSLNQETTLTGKTIISNIKKAKESGYKIHLFYIGVSSVQVSIDRVKARVDNGGHGVPLENLLRR